MSKQDGFEEKAKELYATLHGRIVAPTFEELVKALRAAHNEAVEEAAKECDRVAANVADFSSRYFRRAAGTCGAAIRSLKSPEGGGV